MEVRNIEPFENFYDCLSLKCFKRAAFSSVVHPQSFCKLLIQLSYLCQIMFIFLSSYISGRSIVRCWPRVDNFATIPYNNAVSYFVVSFAINLGDTDVTRIMFSILFEYIDDEMWCFSHEYKYLKYICHILIKAGSYLKMIEILYKYRNNIALQIHPLFLQVRFQIKNFFKIFNLNIHMKKKFI